MKIRIKAMGLVATFTAVALAVTLTACGGGGGDAPGASTPSESVSLAEAAATVGTAPIAKAAINGVITGVTTVGATASVTGKLSITGGVTTVFERPLSLSGTYGTWTMNVTNGDWTYALDSIKAGVIAADRTVTDAMLVKTSDGVVSATVTVNIQGLLSTDSTLVTSVPAATYPVGSEELAAFNLLNDERGRCGFGLVAQNTAIDKAAKAHADYQALNYYFAHLEDSSLPGFSGISPSDRVLAAGYLNAVPGDVSDEMSMISPTNNKAGFGTLSVRNLLNAPYHLRGMVGTGRDIGVSIRSTLDVSSSISPAVFAQYDLAYTKTAGMQLQASSTVNTYPCQGTTGTNYQLTQETPNPVPGRDLVTNPLGSSVYVSVRFGNTLVISNATMTQVSNGANVTLRSPVKYGANDGYIAADAPTLPNTAYQVTISGTNNGAGFSTSFTFTTGTGG